MSLALNRVLAKLRRTGDPAAAVDYDHSEVELYIPKEFVSDFHGVEYVRWHKNEDQTYTLTLYDVDRR